MPPSWLTVIAWTSLGLGVVASGAILCDLYVRGYRQQMRVMEAVWPITALYLGPLAWLVYRRWGRLGSPQFRRETGRKPDYGETVSVSIDVSHCGAGCTLGDIIGAWLVFAAGWRLLGLALPAEYIVDFVLAFTLGIAFQYFAIAPMRNLSVGDGIIAALKADTLSLSAFEIGLFGWMALIQLVFFPGPHLQPNPPRTGF